MDRVTAQKRSLMMSRIGSKDTGPELAVRQALHCLGYRFRLHRRDLPGTPDIVLPGRKTAIFVHGCFWHRHNQCKYCYNPKTNIEFWDEKFGKNIERDNRAREGLEALGWKVFVIWECETAHAPSLTVKLRAYLET